MSEVLPSMEELLARAEAKGRASGMKISYTDGYTDGYLIGRADAEVEHKAMCDTCIHKVSAEDIKQIKEQTE